LSRAGPEPRPRGPRGAPEPFKPLAPDRAEFWVLALVTPVPDFWCCWLFFSPPSACGSSIHWLEGATAPRQALVETETETERPRTRRRGTQTWTHRHRQRQRHRGRHRPRRKHTGSDTRRPLRSSPRSSCASFNDPTRGTAVQRNSEPWCCWRRSIGKGPCAPSGSKLWHCGGPLVTGPARHHLQNGCAAEAPR
jgi:hypothetical protein